MCSRLHAAGTAITLAPPKLRLVLRYIPILAGIFALSACITHGGQGVLQTPERDNSIPKRNVTIALLGATGMVGNYVLSEALAQGYDVRALARTPAKLDPVKQQVSIVEGDARDPAAIDQLLRGSDIVISALGPVKADGDAAKMLSTTATGLIIQSMAEHHITRYIIVSGAAVEIPGDKRNMTGWMLEQSATIALHDTVADKQSEYQLLAASAIEWTLLRCPLIEPKAFQTPALASLTTPASFHLRAGELARFIVEEIALKRYLGRGPFLSSQ